MTAAEAEHLLRMALKGDQKSPEATVTLPREAWDVLLAALDAWSVGMVGEMGFEPTVDRV